MSGEYVPTNGDAMWLHIRDKFVEAFDSEDWEEAYKSADEWLAAHDARIASEAAEKALRDAADDFQRAWPVYGDTWLIAEADRIAAERNAS